MSDSKKILWPIDPRGSAKEMDHALLKFFKNLKQVMNVEIQPIHVVSSQFFVTSEYFEAIEIDSLQKNMFEECQGYLQYFKDLVSLDPIVLNHNYSSASLEVSLLRDFVNEKRPDFVVMATHGRTGWERGFLGSFCESFILQSQVPVMVVEKNMAAKFDLTKGLMPVEVNQEAQSFLETFLDDHRLSFIEDLTLFHKVSLIDLEEIAWAPTMYGLSGYTSHDIVAKAKETTEKYLKSFLDHPLSQKRLDYKMSTDLAPVVDEIVKEVEQGGYGVVVLKSESGTLSANFLGSVTREVIRKVNIPVVVYPHNYKR